MGRWMEGREREERERERERDRETTERYLTHLLHKPSPVSMPKQSPNVSRTATTSLASMLSHAMDMMKARMPRTICMLQWGGRFTCSRKNNATDITIPVKTNVHVYVP